MVQRFFGDHNASRNGRVRLKRRVPRPHFVHGTGSAEIVGDLSHGPPPIDRAVQQSVVRRGVQGVRGDPAEKAIEAVSVQHTGLVQRGLKGRAVVLRAQHKLTWLCWVHVERIRLGDLQPRRQIGHP